MLKIEKVSAEEVILDSLKRSATHGVSVEDMRVGLRKLKKLFKVGNSASVSVKDVISLVSSTKTAIIIRIKKNTKAVQRFIEAVVGLQVGTGIRSDPLRRSTEVQLEIWRDSWEIYERITHCDYMLMTVVDKNAQNVIKSVTVVDKRGKITRIEINDTRKIVYDPDLDMVAVAYYSGRYEGFLRQEIVALEN